MALNCHSTVKKWKLKIIDDSLPVGLHKKHHRKLKSAHPYSKEVLVLKQKIYETKVCMYVFRENVYNMHATFLNSLSVFSINWYQLQWRKRTLPTTVLKREIRMPRRISGCCCVKGD